MKTTVIIASMGRPSMLGEALKRLAQQNKAPHQVLAVVHSEADLPDDLPGYVTVVYSEKGLCRQRNTGMDRCDEKVDFIVFIDDDTFLHPTYIAEVESLFERQPGVAGLTGLLLKNGDVSVDEADELLANGPASPNVVLEDGSLYGCNFAVRRAMAEGIRFDERLVLYGWLEDADFSMSLQERGAIKYATNLLAVHLMWPSGGRVNHVRFGFSQVMNPFYLSRKHRAVFPFSAVLMSHWGKCLLANIGGAVIEKDRSRRLGRLKGNLIAYGFILFGRVRPEHAASL